MPTDENSKREIPANPNTDYLAEEIAEKKTAYASQRQPYADEWVKILRATEMRTKDRKYAWQSNIILPILYTHFRTIFPRIKKNIIGQIPLLSLIGENAEEEAKLIAHYIRKCKGYLQLADNLHETTLFGTGWAKTIQDRRVSRIIEQVPKSRAGKNIVRRTLAAFQGKPPEEIETEDVEREIELWNRPAVYHVPLLNIFTNYNEVNDVDDADIIESKWTMLSWLRMHSKNKKLNPTGWQDGEFDNVEDIEQDVMLNMYQDNEEEFRDAREEVTLNAQMAKKRIALLMCELDYTDPDTGKFYRNGEVVIAQTYTRDGEVSLNVTLKKGPAKRSDSRKSYIRTVYERVPGRLIGRGMGHVSIRIQNFLTKFLRACADRDTISLYRPIAFNSRIMTSNQNLLQIRMGGLMPVPGNPNEVLKDFKIEPSHHGVWQFIQAFIIFGQEASGAVKPLEGMGGAGTHRTATGLNFLLGSANERILDTVRDMAEEMIPDLGDAFHRHIKDNLKGRKIDFTHVNDKGSKEDVSVEVDSLSQEIDVYSPTIFERADRQKKGEQMLQYIQFFGPLLQSGDPRLINIGKVAWTYMEFPEVDKLFEQTTEYVPIEVVEMAFQKAGFPKGTYQRIIAQLAKEREQQAGKKGGGGGGGGGRTPPSVEASLNQGSSPTELPSMGVNTGRGG